MDPVKKDSEENCEKESDTEDSSFQTCYQVKFINNDLHKCIQMLEKASSDTEKFAALLIVPQLINANLLDDKSSQCLLDAIDINFLGRMLGTKDVPEGCPSFMYKSIALTILACFASRCHGDPTLYRLIPLLAEIISNPKLYEEDLTLIKEVYQCLSALASNTMGRKALIDYEVIGSLVDAYIKEYIFNENSLTIIRNVAVDKECKMWEDEPEAFSLLMDHICKDFVVNHDEYKFLLCEALVDIMPSMVDEFPRLSSEGSWKPHLHKGLSDILFSKLHPDLRNKGLQLASVVLEVLGSSFIINGGERGRQLLLLMVHLACVEVRMSFEDKTFQESVSHATYTTACYSIIEEAIKFLICGALDLEEKQKQQLYAALKGAFNGVLEFLHEASMEEEIFTGNSKKIQMFTFASVRVLGAWLAEETSANKEEVYQILPFLIKIARHNFDHNNLSHSRKKVIVKEIMDKLPDIIRFLLPGLCHLTVEDRPRKILLEQNIENFLFEYLLTQWVSVFSMYSEDVQLDLSPYSDTLVTICNIFMNLVVQEPNRVKNDLSYCQLLKLIFSKVPEIPAENVNLQVSGSFCILGLMIFHHQHSRIVNMHKIELNVYRFIQATVRFLWDGFNVEESTDYATLVISTAYREYWSDLVELWYLGMHTLTVILPHVPWICNFLIESEWPQTITETFILVKVGGIEPPVKSAYEDFLFSLIQSSKSAKEVLLAKCIKDVSQSHKLEKLLHIL